MIKVEIEGKSYEVNLERAIELGVITQELRISNGDVFGSKPYSYVMVETVNGSWLVGGLNGNPFELYSDSTRTKEQMIAHIRISGWKFVKNLGKNLLN